jgi:hypothetical protein
VAGQVLTEIATCRPWRFESRFLNAVPSSGAVLGSGAPDAWRSVAEVGGTRSAPRRPWQDLAGHPAADKNPLTLPLGLPR